MLRFRGTPVEVQNYIDDTGVQVADVVVGFRELEQRSRSTRSARIADTTRFDYYCWDLYARVTEWYDGDKARLAIRAATLHDLEHGGNETAAIGAFIADRIVRAHLKTMARLNIGYDLLTYEGDILRLQFWAHAFEILKAQGAVFLQTEGKLAGCWVMRIDEDGSRGRGDGRRGASDGDGRPESAREGHRPIERRRHLRRQGHRQPVLEVRPARPGLPLPAVRRRRPTAGRCGRRRPTDGEPARAAVRAGAAGSTTSSTRGRCTCRRCSARRSRRSAIAREAENSIHFSYEMVALSHATARELGYRPATARTRRSRSSRCRAARALASRSTICSTC